MLYHFFRTLIIIFGAGLFFAPIIFVIFWVNASYSAPGQLMERGLAFEFGFFYWPLLTFLGFVVSILVNAPLRKPLKILAKIYNKRQLTVAEKKLSKFANSTTLILSHLQDT